MKKTLLSLLAVVTCAYSAPALASGGTEAPPHVHWEFSGPFGTYDRAALQRGLKIYREVCSSCHAVKHLAFRNLTDLGYNEEQVKAIAAEYTVTDGPDEDGEMFERPARPSDRFPSPYPNENAAKAANGVAPPDLSLIVKARHHGANHVFGILTGYEEAPEDHPLADGQHWNKYMPGHVIAMAKPLSNGQVTYEDGTIETVEQYAQDVAQFLAWASEPDLEARKRFGISALIFLAVFAGVMYRLKKAVWKDVH